MRHFRLGSFPCPDPCSSRVWSRGHFWWCRRFYLFCNSEVWPHCEPQITALKEIWFPPGFFFFLLWSSVFTRISANPLEVSLPWKCQCLLVPWSSFLLSCSLIHYNTKPEASAPLLYLLLSSGGCKKGQWTNICCLTFSKTKAMSIDWEESWRKAGIHTGRRGKGWVQRKINQAFRGELWAGAVCASVRNWSSFRFTLHWALLWFQLS